MRVITLENIVKLIEDKHNKKQRVVKVQIENSTSENEKIMFIINNDEDVVPRAFINEDGELDFIHTTDSTHCILLHQDLNGFDTEHPFMKCREALAGVLVIDGDTPSEQELRPYMYKLTI